MSERNAFTAVSAISSIGCSTVVSGGDVHTAAQIARGHRARAVERRPRPLPALARRPTLDVSLLGLARPFAAVDPAGERMRATVAALRDELGCAAGSLRRYAGDTYAGGHRWVLAALWLGLWYRQVGEDNGLYCSRPGRN